MDNIKKLKRTTQLVTVLSRYGFEAIISQPEIKKIIPKSILESNNKRKEILSLSIYQRIRLVLEELGPAYIKFGQLLSNRDDILPEELTYELQKLQDSVTIQEIDIHKTITEELSIVPNDYFLYIDSEPIASASLSQVYTAVLKEGDAKVILKIKKKDVLKIVEADLLIMKDFAKILEKYYDNAKKIGLSNILSVFEKSIMSELSFVQELDNMERFRKNFIKNDSLYVPKTYKGLSNANILCMEHINGIKISDRDAISAANLNHKDIASVIIDLYLKQIIDHGFFHADPHSGNIFVLPSNKIVFIDYGSVGFILPQDRELLGDFIIYALKKDTKRVLRVIKKIAINYNISNEIQFERDLYFFLDLLDRSTIQELDMGVILKLFSKLLNENQIILPDYIYLLARGIVLLEGIGRELGIETNIVDNIKPYTLKLIRERLSPKHIAHKVIDKLYDFGEILEMLPEDTHSLIQKINNNELEVTHQIKGFKDIKTTINRVVLALLISSFAIGSSILIQAQMPPLVYQVSVLGILGYIISAIIASVLVVLIFRDKN